jgi:phenylpropionate dioxygenase-like ring-hydroxylating dioxygenase large terminal subunit
LIVPSRRRGGHRCGYAFPKGYYDLDRSRLGLGRVPRVESYKRFVFGSFAEDGPSLKEHLGGAADTTSIAWR